MEYGYPRGHVFYRKLARTYPLVTHGEGIYLYDENGKRYIDGSGGAIVVNVGHGQKEIVRKMTEEMGQVAYVHGTQFTTKSIERIIMLPNVSKAASNALKGTSQELMGNEHSRKAYLGM